ncbi:hypothetical protein [Rhodospirillaceae bacterium SYSU D60014]|uniref:hypothetical protein n=1 Tax=Virgifigura deserti TaxID=2268457 RepID=UPI000E65FACB
MATILAFGVSPAANYTAESSRNTETIAGFTMPAGANALYFGVSYRSTGDAAISSIDWNGDTSAVAVNSVKTGGGSYYAKLWKLPGATPGTGDVTVTVAANVQALRLFVWAVGGVDTLDDIGVSPTFTGVGFNTSGGDNFYTPEADGSLLLAVVAGIDDDSEPSGSYASGWELDEEAGAFHGNDAASGYSGFFHKQGSAAGIQESFTITFSDGGAKALALMEIRAAENTGGSDVVVFPSGIAVMGAVGSVGVGIDCAVAVVGVSGIGAAGSATVDTAGDAMIAVSGISGIGSVGAATIFGWAQAADASGSWSGEGEANDIWAAIPVAPGGWS